jgi:hypothetical protein
MTDSTSNIQHSGSNDVFNDTAIEQGDASMQETFNMMVEQQRKLQMFSMAVNVKTAEHSAKRDAIQNINR